MTTDEFYQIAYDFFEPVISVASKEISMFFTKPLEPDVARVDFVVFQNLYYSESLTICIWPTTLDNRVHRASSIEVPIADLSIGKLSSDHWERVHEAIPERFLEAWRTANPQPTVPCFFGFHDTGEYLNLQNGQWLEQDSYYALIESRLKDRS